MYDTTATAAAAAAAAAATATATATATTTTTTTTTTTATVRRGSRGGPRGPCPPPSPQKIASPNSQARIQGGLAPPGPRGPWPPLTKSWIRL